MSREWPLIGRSEELHIIADATRVDGDRARGVVLSGAAGVGKTRVAREAVAASGPRAARRHWVVGTASARSVPLGAFADTVHDFGPDPLRRVREAIQALVGDHQGNAVIGVDDAHMLDDLSAFTVHQIVTRRLATVILTIRSGETAPDAITAIWKDQHLRRLELQPLSLSETTQLVEYVLDGPIHSHCARRLWQYTQGNALYLRHLIDSEISAGRIARPAGVWVWDGQPALPPALAELLESTIGRAPNSVRRVLDALAVSEPLDVDILARVAGSAAVMEAESLGLVRVEAATVRLAHPMFGEVRRTGSLSLRQLRGRIATELAREGDTDPRALVRRAVLTVESDLPPDPALLLAAASAAMQLMDLRLAESLAQRAVAAGGGVDAKVAHAMTVTWQERGAEAERILAEIADATSGPARTMIAILRATNFAAVLGQSASAERELEMLPADDDHAQAIARALRATIDLTRGHARTGVDRAYEFLHDPPANALAHMLSSWALIGGLGDLGRIDELEPAADSGYALADKCSEVSHLRLPLAFLHAYGYRLAGALTQSDAVIARIQRDTADVPFEGAWHATLVALSAISRGALDTAQRSCQEVIAHLGNGDGGRMVKGFGHTWLAAAAAMAGKATQARREIAAIQWWDQDPAARALDSEKSIAEAWVNAAEGAVSQAISITRDAAAREALLGRPAWEVMLLQTATQFGDHTTAARLAQLANVVQGPRPPAAATHAAALAADDGDGLLDASRRYEEFGDRIAAADAAAQAALAYERAGLRGSALTVSATAQRLAADCGGANTPALRAGAEPLPITVRQREIISLAAQGLSNKQIADRLTMSVRSIQGHLFRASQRLGVNSRDQLIAIVDDLRS
jgi:DNA-binding CsgD family transcriptional regulator